jgi:hypothetical protein
MYLNFSFFTFLKIYLISYRHRLTTEMEVSSMVPFKGETGNWNYRLSYLSTTHPEDPFTYYVQLKLKLIYRAICRIQRINVINLHKSDQM